MCGICGIVHCQAEQPVVQEILVSINNSMVHRGPDGEASHLEPGTGLAMRFQTANNPKSMSNEDDSKWAVLDGEIHNISNLRKLLQAKGHTFRTTSTTEFLTHLYEEFGDKFPDLLTGTFAIALWDNKNRRLLLVRDRLGVKPLYFAHMERTLVFASEFRAILKYPEVNRKIDLHGLSEYMTLQHTLAPRTILAGVKKLPAGYLAVYEKGQLSLREYWDLIFPPDASKNPNENMHVEGLKDAFETSVRRHAIENEPVGVLLSGGLDSSSIVAMLSHLGEQEIHTYSGGYLEGNSVGELANSRIVAKYFKTHHHELAFTFREWADALQRYILYMDTPVADEASAIRMILYGLARNDVKVVLGGEGGDDVMGGYSFGHLIRRTDRMRQFQRLPCWLRQSLLGLMGPLFPGRFRDWLRRGNRDISTINAEDCYVMKWIAEADEKSQLCPILKELDDEHCSKEIQEIYRHCGTADPLSQAQYVFTKTWASENLTMTTDKMAMSHGIEVRLPYFDQELVELCAKIPSNLKVHREDDGSYTQKYIFKKAMRGILPDEMINIPKSPFTVPICNWFHGPLAGLCRDVLLSDSARSSGYYDVVQVKQLLESHFASPTVKRGAQIKTLLFFEMWRQMVLT